MNVDTKPTDAEVVAWLDEHCNGWVSNRGGMSWICGAHVGGCYNSALGPSAAEARWALARELGMGAPTAARPCPLPKVGGWEWRKTYDGIPNVFEARCETWHILATAPTDEVPCWDWVVYTEGHGRCSGITRTRRGAMRAAERAARRAWEVRNASKWSK